MATVDDLEQKLEAGDTKKKLQLSALHTPMKLKRK